VACFGQFTANDNSREPSANKKNMHIKKNSRQYWHFLPYRSYNRKLKKISP
jgi:hypothetical protein